MPLQILGKANWFPAQFEPQLHPVPRLQVVPDSAADRGIYSLNGYAENMFLSCFCSFYIKILKTLIKTHSILCLPHSQQIPADCPRKKKPDFFFLYSIFTVIHCSPTAVEVTLKLKHNIALAASWALKKHPFSKYYHRELASLCSWSTRPLLSACEVFLSLLVPTAPDTHYKCSAVWRGIFPCPTQILNSSAVPSLKNSPGH